MLVRVCRQYVLQCACGGAEGTSLRVVSQSSTLFEGGSLCCWVLHPRGELALQPVCSPLLSVLPFPVELFADAHEATRTLTWSGVLNSGPFAFIASVLPIEPQF